MTDATKTDFTDSMGDVPFMDRVAMRTRGKYVVELAHGTMPDPDGDRWYDEVPCGRVVAADIVAAWPLEYASHGSWDSHILPTLRCLAGYGDRGYGTYQQRQDVALIQDGDEADMPADAIILDSGHLLDDLIDAWHSGRHQAITDTLRQSDDYSLEDIQR